jgi:hypothetical protein
VGINVIAGMILAECHTLRLFCDGKSKSTLSRALPIATAIVGLYLMSYPSEQLFSTWKPWTRGLHAIGQHIFASNAEMGRFWPGVGAQVLCFSIYASTELRALLSKPIPTFLGGISFSLYLLHGPLMRSVLAWMVFYPVYVANGGKQQEQQVNPAIGEYKLGLPNRTVLLVALPAYFAIVLLLSKLWQSKVEPGFARATRALQNLASQEASGSIHIK